MKTTIQKTGIILFTFFMFFLPFSSVLAETGTEKKDYSITYSEVELKVQPGDNLLVLTGQKVYDVQVTENNQSIEVKHLLKPIILTIPLDNKDVSNIDVNKLAVYHLEENQWTLVKNIRWDKKGNQFVFSTNQLGQYTIFSSNQSFADLTSVKSWAQYEVEVMTTKGIINGKKEGVFSPNDKVTRAEFVKMIIHSLDLLEDDIKVDFVDVKTTDWFYQEVATAAKLGIVNGKTVTQFAPYDVITREEMATITVRALNLIQTNQKEELPQFEDQKQISPWAVEAVSIAIKNNLLKGINSTNFAPKENATRAQAAVLAYRLYQLLDEKLAEKLLVNALANDIEIDMENGDAAIGGSVSLTVEEIKDKYQPKFEALEENAITQLEGLIAQAREEYNQTKDNPDFDSLAFVAKYMGKAENLQNTVEQQFNQLVSQMENELKANNLPLNLVTEARTQYEQMVEEMKKKLLGQYDL